MTVEPLIQATHTIPIVFAIVPDPVGSGIVDSLSRPGGNATGFTMFEYSLSGKWLASAPVAPYAVFKHYALASTFRTDDAYHFPPRDVGMPRAFRASAIWCNEVAPARRISRITGRTLAACWSARALMTPRRSRAVELGVTQCHPTLLRCRQRHLRSMANHRPLFLSSAVKHEDDGSTSV